MLTKNNGVHHQSKINFDVDKKF